MVFQEQFPSAAAQDAAKEHVQMLETFGDEYADNSTWTERKFCGRSTRVIFPCMRILRILDVATETNDCLPRLLEAVPLWLASDL